MTFTDGRRLDDQLLWDSPVRVFDNTVTTARYPALGQSARSYRHLLVSVATFFPARVIEHGFNLYRRRAACLPLLTNVTETTTMSRRARVDASTDPVRVSEIANATAAKIFTIGEHIDARW